MDRLDFFSSSLSFSLFSCIISSREGEKRRKLCRWLFPSLPLAVCLDQSVHQGNQQVLILNLTYVRIKEREIESQLRDLKNTEIDAMREASQDDLIQLLRQLYIGKHIEIWLFGFVDFVVVVVVICCCFIVSNDTQKAAAKYYTSICAAALRQITK
jgi:hypothetical protein